MALADLKIGKMSKGTLVASLEIRQKSCQVKSVRERRIRETTSVLQFTDEREWRNVLKRKKSMFVVLFVGWCA